MLQTRVGELIDTREGKRKREENGEKEQRESPRSWRKKGGETAISGVGCHSPTEAKKQGGRFSGTIPHNEIGMYSFSSEFLHQLHFNIPFIPLSNQPPSPHKRNWPVFSKQVRSHFLSFSAISNLFRVGFHNVLGPHAQPLTPSNLILSANFTCNLLSLPDH